MILQVNSEPVTAPADVKAALAKTEKDGRDAILLLVSRKGDHMFVAVPIKAS